MPDLHSQPSRVAVVGTENVGATFAYALLSSGLAAEIGLIDANRDRAEGEAMDLNHAVRRSASIPRATLDELERARA